MPPIAEVNGEMSKQHIELNCADSMPETTWHLKIGTVVAIVLAVLGIAMGGLATWTGYISNKVAVHGEEIATIKAHQGNILATVTRVESILDDVRSDQIRRQVLERK